MISASPSTSSPVTALRLLACLAFATACTPSGEYLNPVVTVAPVPATARTEVLLIYANETAPAGAALANFELFLDWLQEADQADGGANEQLHELVRQFVDDRSRGPFHVDREQRALEQADLRAKFPTLRGVMMLSNRLANAGTLRLWDAQSNQWSTMPFAAPPIADPIRAGQPDGVTSTLRNFLDVAAQTFDPQQSAFVLLLESHGTAELVATPRLFVDAAKMGKARVLRIARGEEQYTEQRPGISKAEFYGALAEAGTQHGAFFSYVFTESCDSGAGVPERDRLPKNLGVLQTTSPNGTKSGTIRFPELLEKPTARPLSAAIQAQLAARTELHATWLTPLKVWLARWWAAVVAGVLLAVVGVWTVVERKQAK